MLPESPPFPARPTVLGGNPVWQHGSPARDVVLMSGAPGPEGAAAYQAWAVLAARLAARGLAVFRHDWPGEGDAADPDEGGDRFAACLAAFASLYDAARALPGVQRVSVVALGAGCLLASRALAGRSPDQLVLMQPPANGRRAIRLWQAEARLTAGADPDDSGDLVLRGHRIAAADLTRLAALTLAPLPPAGRVTRVSTEPGTGEDAEETLSFAGYAEMMSPASMLPPLAVFDAIGDRLAPPTSGAPALLPAWETMSAPAPLAVPGGSEQRLRFGLNERLAGVLCEPETPAPGHPCVIMPNAGPNPHHGWGRMAVAHARQLSGAGIASLRFDLSGLGDSGGTTQSPRALVYNRRHHADLAAAVDLARLKGSGRIVVAGLCAGGYLAFHALGNVPRIDAAVCANVLRLDWTDEDDLDAYERATVQSTGHYRDMALSGSALRRILAGEVSIGKVARVAGQLGARIGRKALERLGFEGPVSPQAGRFRDRVRAATARGAALTFASSIDDPSIEEAERYFGAGCRALDGLDAVTVLSLGPSDHELSTKKARDRLYDIIAGHALASPVARS